MDKKYTADDIQILSAGEAVRRRPHLYFGKCFSEKTLDSLPFEVLCHAFDEYFDGNCKKVEISISHDSFTVNYDAGISLDLRNDGLSKAEAIMTQIGVCKNEKKHLTVGEEFCSLGMATINFAAEQCELTTVSNGKKGIYLFKDGNTISRIIETCKEENEFTHIFIRPNKSLFENLAFTAAGINEKVNQINLRLNDFKIIIHNNLIIN